MKPRFVTTVDGRVDATYRPGRRGRGHPPDFDGAAQRLEVALFILDYQHDHQLCQLKEAIYAARCVRFGTPRRPGFSVGYAFAALQEWLRDHVVETVSWIGGDGSKLYRVRGADGRWRDVPNGELITRPN